MGVPDTGWGSVAAAAQRAWIHFRDCGNAEYGRAY